VVDEPKFKDEIQGLIIAGDDVIYDSWAEANGKPPLKKASELLTTGDQVLEWLLREYSDPPEDKDGPAAADDKPA
jgi:hypothetical protein